MKIYIEKKTIHFERIRRESGYAYKSSSITIYGNCELPLCEDSFFWYFTEKKHEVDEWDFEDPFSYGETVTEDVGEDITNEKLLIKLLNNQSITIGKKEECPYVLGKRYFDFCQLSNSTIDNERNKWLDGLEKLQKECERPRYEMMKSYMLKDEFDINKPIPKNGNSALGESFIYRDSSYARSLIDKGAWYIEYDSYKSSFEGYYNGYDGKYYVDDEVQWEKEYIKGMGDVYRIKQVTTNKDSNNSTSSLKLNFYEGLKLIHIPFGATRVATTRKHSEWTQNLNVLKFVISELGVDYYQKLIDNMYGYYSIFPCEEEIAIIKFKYFIKSNNSKALKYFLSNETNKLPELQKMLACKGIPIWYDNEFVELYCNSSYDLKIIFENWRASMIDRFKTNGVNVIRKIHGDSDFNYPEDYIHNKSGQLIWDIIRGLQNNDINLLKCVLEKIKQSESDILKRIVLGLYFRGVNSVVNAYFESNSNTKLFFYNWRKENSELYLTSTKLPPLLYRDKEGKLLTKRQSFKTGVYEISWTLITKDSISLE